MQLDQNKITPPWIPSLMNHYNKKLTSFQIINNKISDEESLEKWWDSRSSLYFVKEYTQNDNESSIYFIQKSKLAKLIYKAA